MNAKIIVVDDHTLFRKGLIALLKNFEEIEIIAEAANGREAIEKINGLAPDIALLDIDMPIMNGYEVLRQMKKEHAPTRAIVIAAAAEEKYIVKAIEAGAAGYLPKNVEPAEIIAAITSVMNSGYFLDDRTNKAMFNKIIKKNQGLAELRKTKMQFTEKEISVLQYLWEEMTSKEIAEKLYLSPRTIEGMRQNMLQRVGVRTVTGLFKFAIRKGMIVSE